MESAEVPACKHEFVRIYQRKLKGLERRLVATKAYLPVGFKMTDFGHLSEGSYCFCSKCRARLFPKRTAADKAQARLALAQSKLAAAENLADVENIDVDLGDEVKEEASEERDTSASISVEELDLVALDLDELGDSKTDNEEDGEEDG